MQVFLKRAPPFTTNYNNFLHRLYLNTSQSVSMSLASQIGEKAKMISASESNTNERTFHPANK